MSKLSKEELDRINEDRRRRGIPERATNNKRGEEFTVNACEPSCGVDKFLDYMEELHWIRLYKSMM